MLYFAARGADSPVFYEMRVMKRWQSLVIGLIISAVALFFAFRQADFGEMLQALKTARYAYVLLSLLLTIALTQVRGWRWSVLTQGRLTPFDGFWLFNIGFLFNNFLPARLGEFARAWLAGRRPKMHFSSALSSIVVEPFVVIIPVLLLAAIVLRGRALLTWATVAGA